MKTFMAVKEYAEKSRRWYVVDATDKVLGRMATRIASVLMGKTNPYYTPHVDTGDFVVVVNAGKVKLTGDKMNQKVYEEYSGYHGGKKLRPVGVMLEKHSERVITLAVRRMLPRSRLGRAMLKKLKVYAGPAHHHQAQQPIQFDI
ncbi:MAG TPA: 50S ribosomal protein L13 [Candidatus Brocadiia bacterium]|nr:50S ribosomal protein L13 [Candidatus Brocadiales bacterium]